MTAALKIFSRIVEDIFERHMLRAASRISSGQQLFSRCGLS
jgi:hypothetical protein